MEEKILKVGLDLDGVILYNPARIVRPFVAIIKKLILHKKRTNFYVPKSPWERYMWHIFHKSSIFVAPGFEEFIRLADDKQIELYIITARYSFLKPDLEKWLRKINVDKHFTGWFYNEKDEQPHLFKERMITKLGLDIFVEDNWDIVRHCNEKLTTGTRIFWIYNLFDKKIDYPFKFPTLKKAANNIIAMKKKRLLIVSDFFYPHWTGISKAMLNLIKSQENKFDITVITTRFKPTLPVREILHKAVILRVDYLFTIVRTKFSIAMISKFFSEVRRNNIVLINSPSSVILPVSLIAWLFRRRLIIFHQGDLILPRGIMNRVIEAIFFVCTYLSCIMADQVSTYTEDYATHSYILKHFMYKFTPLLMPIYHEKPEKDTWVKEKIQQLRTPKRVIFGFAGRFVEEKGFDILFDAIALIQKSHPEAYFVFAGDRKIPYEHFFENHASQFEKILDQVLLLDLLSDHELYDFYQSIDAIIIPSRSDCFNLVQAEAMLMGKPSIVADIAGARTLVRETGFGFIFKGQSASHLATVIQDFMKDPRAFTPHASQVARILDNAVITRRITEFLER